jgi:endothelin-converting enzyme/putative endopeptidase
LIAQQKLGFDAGAIDRSISPCDNFYQFACGNWVKTNPIPGDQARWGRFDALAENNREVLKKILEEAAKKTNRTPVEQKIGDYYATCMDEKNIESKGIRPMEPDLKRIRSIADKANMAAEVARLQKQGIDAFFQFGSEADFKDASVVIANIDQGGLGLPDRDYYLKTDAKSTELRKQYAAHLQKMFELAGTPAAAAAQKAEAVMRVETALAKGSLELVARRDPAQIYHKEPVAELTKLAPAFNWNRYFTDIDAPKFSNLNISVPSYFQAMNGVLRDSSLDDLKAYLEWHYIHTLAPILPSAFVNEDFNFFSKTLRGTKELRPRWKRCVAMVDADLGEAVGQRYVELTFGKEGKARTLKMVKQIEAAMEKDIQALDWMTPATKQKALEKLHTVANKIGYPDKWRDYSKLHVELNDAVGNSLRSNTFEMYRRLQKIGNPADRTVWGMSPPTVNAYYNPLQNNINFPAGILQPPFYDNKIDDPVNYGAVGSVIGHELTHGFDDEGRQFDAKGNFDEWWTKEDAKAFEERADCIKNEYGNFIAVHDVKLNGKLTLGENTADNGGLRLAYMALMDSLAGKTLPQIDGFTPEQRFFLGFAQLWCNNSTEENARLRALTDPHSPGRYRVNGTVQNMPEFQKAWACKAGQAMVSPKPCRVW